MEFTITEKKENKALGRQELECSFSYEGAMPSRKEIRSAACAATGASPELVVVVSVKGSFGSRKADVKLRIYSNKDSMKAEREYLLARDGLVEKKAGTGKPAAGAQARQEPKKEEKVAAAPKKEEKKEPKPEAKTEEKEQTPEAGKEGKKA